MIINDLILLALIIPIFGLLIPQVLAQEDTTNQSEIQDIELQRIETELQRIRVVLEDSSESSTKQGFVTVFAFLVGIALVLLGLSMSQRRLTRMGKYYTILILALSIPVTVLVVEYIVSGGEPYLFVDYIPTGGDPFIVLAYLFLIPLSAVFFLVFASIFLKAKEQD